MGVPDDAVIQLHVIGRQGDGETVYHGTPVRRLEVDRDVAGVGCVVALEG